LRQHGIQLPGQRILFGELRAQGGLLRADGIALGDDVGAE
jgi:hypothetical protein